MKEIMNKDAWRYKTRREGSERGGGGTAAANSAWPFSGEERMRKGAYAPLRRFSHSRGGAWRPRLGSDARSGRQIDRIILLGTPQTAWHQRVDEIITYKGTQLVLRLHKFRGSEKEVAVSLSAVSIKDLVPSGGLTMGRFKVITGTNPEVLLSRLLIAENPEVKSPEP